MVYKSASTDRTSARSKPPLAAFNRDPRKGTPQISISFREKLRRAAGTKGDNGENTTAFTSRRLVHRWTERKISNLDIYSARPRLRPKDVSIRDLSLSLVLRLREEEKEEKFGSKSVLAALSPVDKFQAGTGAEIGRAWRTTNAHFMLMFSAPLRPPNRSRVDGPGKDRDG